MKLTFLGAAGTVTGSKYLLEAGGFKYLIDCGLFQGKKELRLKNWDLPPFNPEEISAILLTHAHIDHSGFIPKLVKYGFKGMIYCSKATMDLCKILLPDSGHLQEEDAYQANRHGYSKHKPALPLYTEQDARNCLKRFKGVEFEKEYKFKGGLTVTLYHAGHILGASFMRISDGKKSIVFSGDLGRFYDPVMKEPTKIPQADYVVVESTYGDRLHNKYDPTEDIETVVNDTVYRGGTVVIPAFAVGRAQVIMYYLYKLKVENRLPKLLRIYLDSPMAINTSGLLCKYMNDHRMPEEVCMNVCNVADYVKTTEQSKSLDSETNHMPSVIISASGMATGGRVLHHLKRFMGDSRSTILLAGYQAAGTRGDRLARGEKEIKIHGKMWPVNAKVVKLDNMSGHADYSEILRWLGGLSQGPRQIFVTHGEPEAAASMAAKVKEKYHWNVLVPTHGQTVELE